MSDPSPFERARRRVAGGSGSAFDRAKQRQTTPEPEAPGWGERISRAVDLATNANPIARAGRTMLADVAATVPRVGSMLLEPGPERQQLQSAANAIEEWGAPRDAVSTGAKLLTGVGKYMALGPVAGVAIGSAEAAADPRFSQTSLVAELAKVQRPGIAGDVARATGRAAEWMNQTPTRRAIGDAAIGEIGSRVLTATARGLGAVGGAAERTAAKALDRLNPIPDDVVEAATRDGLPRSGRITPERFDEFANEIVQPPQRMPTEPRLKRLGPGTFAMPADSRALTGGDDAWKMAMRWEQADRPVSPPLLPPEALVPDAGPRRLPASTRGAWPMPAAGVESLGQARARLEEELARNPRRQAMLARAERIAAAPPSSDDVLREMADRERGTDDLFRLQGGARTNGGARRPVARVRTEALLDELADYDAKRVDAQQRAQYAWVDDSDNLHYTGTVVPSADRGADGVSRQAKALTNLEDYQRITDDILGELQARGLDENTVWEQVARRLEARDGGRRATESARNASLRARLDTEAVGAADPVARAEIEARTGPEPDYQVGDGEGFDLFSVGSSGAARRALSDHPVASTVTGAAVGASTDEDNRLRGAALGAAAGYAAHRVARGDAALGLTTKRLEEGAEELRQPRLSALHNTSVDGLRAADKLGGLPVPSVAVVKSGDPFSQFGNITLIGKRDLGDPAKVPVMSADGYTARQPRPEYKAAPWKTRAPLHERLRQAEALIGDGALDGGADRVSSAVDYHLERGDIPQARRTLERSDAARLSFLREQGVNLDVPRRATSTRFAFSNAEPLRTFVAQHGVDTQFPLGGEYHRALSQAAARAAEDMAGGDAELLDILRGDAFDEDGMLAFGRAVSVSRDLKRLSESATEVDRGALSDALGAALHGREPEFQRWVDGHLAPFTAKPMVRVGRKALPYTLENVTDAMTRQPLAGAEQTMTFGPGRARAMRARKFDDLESMRNYAGWQLAPEPDVKAAEQAFGKALGAWRSKLLEANPGVDTWRALDGIHEAMSKAKRVGIVAKDRAALATALRAKGLRNVPADLLEEGEQLTRKLFEAPGDYFEAKPQRAVGLEEFAGAVIPKDTPADVREMLTRRGIPFREYTDATDRETVRQAFMDELQQNGGDVRFSVGSTPAFLAASKRVLQSPAGSAATGAVVGASVDQDNPTRGALVGAAIGAGASALVRRAAKAGAPLRLTGDADVDAVLGTIARGERTAPKADRMLTAAQQAYTKILDQLYPLRKFGRDVGGSDQLSNVATQASGWRSSANQRARESLAPILEATKGRREEVMALAKAQRALALLDAGLEKTDIPRDVLERTVKKLEQDADVADGARQLQDYYRSLLDYKRANGVITQDAFDAIVDAGDFYTPFVREFDDVAGKAPTAGGGRFVNKGTGVRKMDAERASSRTVDPFEQALLDTFETHRTVAKQRVSNVLAETVEANDIAAHPFLRRVENQQAGRQGRVVAANIGGERRYYEVVDEDLYNAWASYDPQQQNILVTLAAPFKRALQSGVTLLPDFAAANALRDNVMTALQYPFKTKSVAGGAAVGAAIGAATSDDPGRGALQGAGLGLGVGGLMPNVLRSLSAMRAIVKDEKVYRQWLKDGGGGFGGMYPRDPASARKLLKELERNGVQASDIINPKRWVDALHYIGSVAEQAPRLAAYRDALATGADAAGAVARSADISLDFSKSGTHTKGIAATTAFWNAKVQGWDKLVRLLKNPKTWAQGAAMITAPSIALWSVNKDNPEYWDRPQWERNLFWLVPRGEGQGFYRIPKPFEVGYLFASIPERILDYAHEKDPEALAVAMRDMLSTAAEGSVPLLPTAAQPIVENMANHSFFRNRPVVDRPDLAPERQFDARTSSLALGAGKLTGTSPQQIDNVISGYTGGAGKVLRDVTDRIARATGMDDRPLPADRAAVPVIGDLGKRFTTRDNGTSDAESLFWSKWERADEAYRTVRDMVADGETEDDVRAFIRRRADDLRGYETLKETRAQLLEVRKAQRQIVADRAMPDERKRRVQSRLRALATQLAQGSARGDVLAEQDR